jgi:diguanylate cyclase (GGDEF)-like protein
MEWHAVVSVGIHGIYNNAEEKRMSTDGRQALDRAVATFRSAAERVLGTAQYDALTALPNRSLFLDRLTHALARARRNEQSLTLLLLDLDRFKHVNDALGPSMGDRALQAVASVLRASSREIDTIARLGNDEFALILEANDADDTAVIVVDRIKNALTEPVRVDDHEVYLTASIGLASYPRNAAEPDQLLQAAEVALYRAKSDGGDTYAFFSAEMNAHAGERLRMAALLRQALVRGEFVLHYQPKVAMGTGAIVGVEALIRWNSAELGFVSPAKFIPLAEETGLIVPIGEWVLRGACRQNKVWQDEGFAPLVMSVNVSPKQFRRSNIVQTISAMLQETGLGAEFLEIEITEGTVMQRPEQAIATLSQLDRLGVQVSIDDFGTGYSSLAYLKRFPVHTLKIDQSFVRGINSDESDAAIVMAIIALAKRLKLKLVAEGVETKEQLAFLTEMECDEYQGYYFSKPVPAVEFGTLLRAALGSGQSNAPRH